jgi:hypothetical protein
MFNFAMYMAHQIMLSYQCGQVGGATVQNMQGKKTQHILRCLFYFSKTSFLIYIEIYIFLFLSVYFDFLFYFVLFLGSLYMLNEHIHYMSA